jgi:hypothetical protein
MTPTVRQDEEQQDTSPILSSTIPDPDLSVDFSTIMSSAEQVKDLSSFPRPD